MQVELHQVFFDSVISFAAFNAIPVTFPDLFDVEETVRGQAGTDLYLKASIIQVPPTVLTVCGDSAEYNCIAQISVYYKSGLGVIKPLEFADKIAEFYPVKTKLDGGVAVFQVILPASIMQPVSSDNGWVFIPVQVRLHSIK